MNNKSYILCLFFITVFFSCSLNKMAANMVADSMASSGSSIVFSGDNDPELIGDALPFILKMNESLLNEVPENYKLFLTTGKGFIMYANAYVHTPALMLGDSDFNKQKKMLTRAKLLYIRGRDYVLKGLELKHRGFNNLMLNKKYKEATKDMKKDDVPYMFWAAAGWMGAYSTDALDIEMGSTISGALALMKGAITLDDSFDGGAIHDFYVSYYGGLPSAMGGSEKKARFHFEKSVRYSKGLKASPYVSLATTVSIKNQNLKEYTGLLNKALEIDVNKKSRYRLANIISQRKARWFLEHKEDKFLIDSEKENDNEEN